MKDVARPKVARWLTYDPRSTLDTFKRGLDAGYESALWDAIVFCELTGEAKPEWAKEALVTYALHRIKSMPLKNGRRAIRNLARDVGIYMVVKMMSAYGTFGRKTKYETAAQPPGPKAKSRLIPQNRAFREAQKCLAEDGHHLSIGAIRKAYENVWKMLPPKSAKSYVMSPFLDWKSFPGNFVGRPNTLTMSRQYIAWESFPENR